MLLKVTLANPKTYIITLFGGGGRAAQSVLALAFYCEQLGPAVELYGIEPFLHYGCNPKELLLNVCENPGKNVPLGGGSFVPHITARCVRY